MIKKIKKIPFFLIKILPRRIWHFLFGKDFNDRISIGFESSFDFKNFKNVVKKGVLETHPVHRYFLPRIAKNILHPIQNKIIFCDIGCNRGVFSKRILEYLPDIEIIGFEPQLSNHKYLDRLSNNKNFSYRKVGLGDKIEKRLFSEYGNDGLSSFAELDENYSYGSHLLGQNKVKEYHASISTLDHEFLDSVKKLFLKIDVQGYELNVLKGSQKLFEKGQVNGIIIELMTIQKYNTGGSTNWKNLLDYLDKKGFILSDFISGYREPSGIMTEFDALFLNKSFFKELNGQN